MDSREAQLDEAELLDLFGRAAVPAQRWTHLAHLTVAYWLLRRHGLAGAIERMGPCIRALNAANGVVDAPDVGYHETVTVAWLRIIDGLMRSHGGCATAAAFLEEHPYLLSRRLLRLFYTRDRILTAEAKGRYVAPDLRPLGS